MPDLDDRIRSLVASAVADAPPAPRIDEQHVRAARPTVNWVKRGSLALAALLAAGGGGLVLSSGDDSSVDTETGTDTSTTLVAPPPPSPSVIVTAGPNGVREIVDGESRVITTEPMVMALSLDDGSVVAQRRSGGRFRDDGTQEYPKSDTAPLLIKDGGMTRLLDTDKLDGFVILHDFSIVEGRRLLLYSVDRNSWGGEGDGGNEELYALDLDTKDVVDLGSIGGWEASTSRLTLGSNGLIIGTDYGACCDIGGLVAIAVPGSPAAATPLPKLADFGFEELRTDGCACPTRFVLDAEGTTLYWLSPVNDDTAVKVMAATFGDPHRHTEVVSIDERFGGLRIDPSDRGVVVTHGDPNTRPTLITKDSSTTLEGTVATVGPNG